MSSPYGSSAFTRPQSYAPTPYSYIPQSTLNATISVDQEVVLPSNAGERDLLDSLAELYSIIVTLDDLEKAFNKGSVTAEEYTNICRLSINSYQNILRDEKVAKEFGSIESFKREWNIEVPRATERLRVMIPATTELSSGPSISKEEKTEASNERVSIPSVQETVTATENFITFLDAVKLGIVSKDQLHPLLSDVITSANNVTKVDFEGRASIIKWLIKLNQMRATDELDEQQKREIEFDIGAAYTGFKKALGG